MKRTTELTEIGLYDVAVCGGGPAGCAAALAAARQGLSVLVLEAQGQLGGMGTSGLVSHWLGGRTRDCKHWAVGGIFRELSIKAVERGIALLPEPEPNGHLSPHGWCAGGPITAGVPFDPFGMAALLDDVMAEESVEVLLFTRVVDVVAEEGTITHVVVHNKSGLQAVPAKVFIDATGDADVAALSGCDVVKGREGDQGMAPVTLQIHVDHIDAAALAEYAESHKSGSSFRFLEEIQTLMDKGEWPFAFNRLISVQLTEPDTFMLNTSRLVGVDGTDGRSLSDAMAAGRRESFQLLEILRKHCPGFENARVKAVAPLLGVRETRRIVGDFVLTVQDIAEQRDASGEASPMGVTNADGSGEPSYVREGMGGDGLPRSRTALQSRHPIEKTFPDVIGLTAYGWDLPNPNRPSDNPDVGKERGIKKSILEIPFRIMVPRPITNLVCPGRAVSVEREVLGPFRVMAPCMAMGEAAGIAAAQVAGNGIAFREIDVRALRSVLAAQNAILDVP